MTEPPRVLLLAEVSPADTYYVDVQPHGSEALPIPPPPQALRREVWTAVVVGNAFGLAAMVSVYMLWSTGSTGCAPAGTDSQSMDPIPDNPESAASAGATAGADQPSQD